MDGSHGGDVISGGPGRPARPWRFWAVVALVVAAVTGAALVQRHGRPGPAPAPSTTPGVQTAGQVAVEDVCTLGTDRRSTVTVAFTLVNHTLETVGVTGVEPSFPLGGLRTLSVTTAAGTCVHAGGASSAGTLAPGDSLLVTFLLGVPAGTCPQPLPVAVRVRVLAHGELITTVLPVVVDLGRVPYPGCPT
ncbi:MAG TPA: hypothetical protein VJT31_21810 [Rugosimonospora sp.]|nr:hypothetical protein [Rugosimonospora sp.]